MTSLAYQLKRLALPQTDSSLFTRKEVASLLFDCKEAATIDRETFFAIGCTGLEELVGIDPSFEEFQSTLFSQAAKGLERSVQTKEVNARLDENITSFLIHLSPFFMLKPAQKCLEWLIHRFHIHLYNQDSLIGCILPFHETKVFVRTIQLLKLNDPTHRWNWLRCIQKPGVPLARSTLITHCYKDLDFMDFICNLVTKTVKAHADYPNSVAQLRVLFSFYASTIVAALSAVDKVTDPIVAKLLPYIQKGLKSSLADYRAATYMIISQLAVKVILESSLVNTLAQQLSRALVKIPILIREGLSCLIILLQHQKTEHISQKTFNNLCNVPGLIANLQEIDARYKVCPLLHHLLPNLIRSISIAEREEDQGPGSQTHLQLLEAILQNITLENNLDQTVANLLLEEYISHSTQDIDPDSLSALNQKTMPLVRLLETRYPKAYEFSLGRQLNRLTSQREQDVFNRFIALSLSSAKHQLLTDSDTSLLLSLNHPQPNVRRFAMEHLKEIIKTSQEGYDNTFLKESILERIKDDSPEVVLAALQALKAFSSQLGQEETVSSLLSLLQRADLSENEYWYVILEEAVNFLCVVDLLQGNEKLTQLVWMELLPYTLLTNPAKQSVELKITKFIVNSELCSMNPLLRNWPAVLEELLESCDTREIVGEANQKMIQLLVNNLCSMEPSVRTQMIRNILQIIEREPQNLKQKLTSVVLSFALVQTLEMQTSPENLQHALQMYAVLEIRLKKLVAKSKDRNPLQKWHLHSIEGNLVPIDLVTEYVENMKTDDGGRMEAGFLLILLLRNLIMAFKPPESLKEESWWNPESLDEQSCNYLHLLIDMFDLLASGTSEGSLVISFRILLQFLVQIHLREPNHLFKFLSLLWTYNYNLGDQLNRPVGVILQTRALYVGCALLDSAGNEFLSSQVVVSLVITLGSPVREVRRAAIACLQRFAKVPGSAFHVVVNSLVNMAEEIIADPTHLSQALGTLFEEVLTASGPARSQRTKLKQDLENFLQYFGDRGQPSYITRNLLKAFEQVNGEMVLSSLLPLMERLLGTEPDVLLKDEALLLHMALAKYNEQSATLLAKNPQSLDLFISVFHNSKEVYKGLPALQITAFGQITKRFFAALLDVNIQQRLLGVLFDLLVQTKNPVCAQAISSIFKAIVIDAEQVARELVPLEKSQNRATIQQTRRQKMLQQRKAQDTPNLEPISLTGNINWQRVTLILELLQHKKKLKKPQVLVPSLFSLLSRCLDPALSEQSSLEYTKQLILNCLLNLCQKLSPDGSKISNDVLDEEKFNVELIVQCVRGSNMPQTHHHALLLLGAAAGMFPDKVLHNIMPIFTFMGANVMRLDDSYSFQVINKTVQTVIPALIRADNEGPAEIKQNMGNVVTKIIRVFVDAMPHVPEHRRVPVLSTLIDTVSAERFLWALLMLLFEQHVTKNASSATNGEKVKEAVLERDVEFWITVGCEFTVREQLQSFINILRYLAKLPEDKEEKTTKEQRKTNITKNKTRKANEVESLFNVDTHTAKELRHLKFLSVSFMAQHLASNSFIGKVADCNTSEEESLQMLQQSLLEEILCYINVVAHSVEENADNPTAKFWRALLNRSYDVLDKVNALLPTETFIPVIRGLMSNHLPSVRRKAMDLLNNKLQQHKATWQENQVKLLLSLIEQLLNIVCCKEIEVEQAINRQTALFSLKLLCRCFGAGHQDFFVPVLVTTVDLIAVDGGEEERNLMGNALLCIAEVTTALKALAIPQLPRLMPGLLKTLKKQKSLLSNEIYLLSAVTALQRVTETLSHFISPYLLDVLIQITQLTNIAAKGNHSSQLDLRLTSLRTTLATKLASRVLLPSISKCYDKLADTKESCLGPLLDILKEHICHMEKEQLTSHQSELTSFFLKALDFRAGHLENDLDKVGEIEGHVINCLVGMIMKLSEVTFRPLFFKLFDWSKSEGFPTDRLITFYRLADSIADKLKGLFTLFAGQLVKPFAEILNQTNTAKTDESFFDSDNSATKSCLLLQFVTDCMHKIFLFDTQQFVSKERTDTLMMPLVDQLENMLGGEEEYKDRVTKHLIPCIAQFSVAIGDDSFWKPLNYQILLKTRHSSPKVRFSALIMLLELAGKLKENYMVLLPETIPFLAELLEDECEEVEHHCQKVIQQLEVILGEPLQSYF
ncbi:HEAT repeat-containing protein 1 isoform X1 [Leucoraja erinacea]|uniref:HEAT repeat-containing protein 1 isoform X1 n=1 Tax=Leucoraja erinaceus TaxID=7782 RepID=UPI002458DF40|nr:HEAT repeat-containing protein 1 isoform X1 [Leucoraja erinacea]XP_055495532.1 HEAT repeat-containing protein 1 isoform X1 [Leucoraja erinacea]